MGRAGGLCQKLNIDAVIGKSDGGEKARGVIRAL
jgi:hypothetical protein